MKTGFRTPSVSKSINARTTGKIKRSVKRSVNPLYGKKGMGYINNPQKAVYNKVYNKTTSSIFDYSSKSTSELSSLTVVELKNILRENGLKVSGNKQELINRIKTASLQQPDYSPNITNYDTYDSASEYITEEKSNGVGCGVAIIATLCAIPIPIAGIFLWIIGFNGMSVFAFIVYAIIILICYCVGQNS